MAKTIKLTFNPFQENTYVVYNEHRECWIIDPGNSNPQEDRILEQVIDDHGLHPVRLLLTHAHVDHVMGNAFVHERYGLRPFLHPTELPMLQLAAQSAALYGLPFRKGPEPEGFIREGEPLNLGSDLFEVVFTPGHSPGEVCIIHHVDRFCLAGDVLFQGSIGRSDLPGGDHNTLLHSIQHELMTLDDDYVVFSGHGPDTTIGQERHTNPFLQTG